MKFFHRVRPTLWAGLLAAFFSFFAMPIAHADLGYWSAALVGNWRHPSNGDRYQFHSNGTYIFTSGPAKARTGHLSHSGFWKIVQPTQKESGGSLEGPVALILRSKTRVVLERKRRILRSNRTFRILVDSAADGEENSMRSDYYIDGVRWKRVK